MDQGDSGNNPDAEMEWRIFDDDEEDQLQRDRERDEKIDQILPHDAADTDDDDRLSTNSSTSSLSSSSSSPHFGGRGNSTTRRTRTRRRRRDRIIEIDADGTIHTKPKFWIYLGIALMILGLAFKSLNEKRQNEFGMTLDLKAMEEEKEDLEATILEEEQVRNSKFSKQQQKNLDDDDDDFASDQIDKTFYDGAALGTVKVCVKARKPNPRMASIFIRNYPRRFGGRIEFMLDPPLYDTLNEAYRHGILSKQELDLKRAPCDKDWPELVLSLHEDLKGGSLPGGTWMVVADEVCKCPNRFCSGTARTDSKPLAPLRHYFSTTFASTYIPLGPQFWFTPFESNEITRSSDRYYSFNFAGSATSHSRMAMANLLMLNETKKKYPSVAKGFIHVKSKWSSNLKSKGYVNPHQYRQMLLNSTFTLCPMGGNPEAFRIHEAVDAGSIPILALDEQYQSHGCHSAYQPYLDAPFVFLKDWSELPEKLEELMSDPRGLDRMQQQLDEWKRRFWANIAETLDCTILKKHNTRNLKYKYELTHECETKL